MPLDDERWATRLGEMLKRQAVAAGSLRPPRNTGDTPDDRDPFFHEEPIYPYVRGPEILNELLAYGEDEAERRWSLSGGRVRSVPGCLVRTRSGRYWRRDQGDESGQKAPRTTAAKKSTGLPAKKQELPAKKQGKKKR